MKWTEIIHLTAAEKVVQQLLEMMPERCTALYKVSGIQQAAIMLVDKSYTDFVIVIEWMVTNSEPRKSREGYGLAQYLEQFGMVNHKVMKQIFPPDGVMLRGGY